MAHPVKSFLVVNEISWFTSNVLSHIVLKLKIPSLVPISALNPLCNLLTSLSILSAILCWIIFRSNLEIWVMRLIVRNSVHFSAFGLLGRGINIDCCISVGMYPLLYIVLHNSVTNSRLYSSKALSASIGISSVPVALTFWIIFITCSTSSFKIFSPFETSK